MVFGRFLFLTMKKIKIDKLQCLKQAENGEVSDFEDFISDFVK
jgi:hypothetical protein